MNEVLVLYYGRDGRGRQLAQCVEQGFDGVGDMAARLRMVPSASAASTTTAPAVPERADPTSN
jgi:hypothetical protein